MSNISFHKSFKLNGISFSSEDELLKYSEQFSVAIHQFLTDWFSSEDFIVVQTSGSTGTPKQIQLKKEFVINSAKATGTFFNLKENTTALLCLSPNYIAGKVMLVRSLVLGWSLDVVAPTSKINIEKQYDFSAMVPMQLRSSLSEIYNIKKLIVGGGVVANDLMEKIQSIPTEIFATYGMTETITHIAVKKLNNFSKTSQVYKTLPNVKIYIDSRNCLAIKAEKISDDFIITNDVVQLISDTQFEWLGRFDNVINSGGIKLHPEKIEEKLSKVITQRFFVAGIKDVVLGEKLILLVEGNITKELKETLKLQILNSTTLTKYEQPKEVYFLTEFIETATKKIQRNETLKTLCF